MAAIEIVREETGHVTYGRYLVRIDGQEVGTLRNGETGHYEVGSGRHDVAVTLSRLGSRTLSISLKDEETARLRCRLVGFRNRIRVATYETDRHITLETVEQPEGADIRVAPGPTVAGRKDFHRTIAFAIGVLGVLMLVDSLLLLHLGELRRGTFGAFVGAATLPFAYLEWQPRSRRVDGLKTAWFGICITVFALSALVHRLPLDSTVLFIIALVMGIGVLAIGALRLFDVEGGENR